MKEIFKIECDRAFRNKKFVLVALMGCLIALLDLVGTSWLGGAVDLAQYAKGTEPGYSNVINANAIVTALYFWMPNHGDVSRYYYIYKVLIPVLAAIPYGSSYVEDKRNGLINQLVTRCKNKRDYYIAKFAVTFLNGGTVAIIPLVASLVISLCVAPWGVPVYSVSFYAVGKRAVFAEIFYQYPALYVMIYLLYVFVMFGLLNCLCLTVGFIEENKYAVTLIPFIVYYGSSFILKYFFGSTASLMTTSGMMLLYKDIAGYVGLQLFIIFAADMLFFIKIKKDVI